MKTYGKSKSKVKLSNFVVFTDPDNDPWAIPFSPVPKKVPLADKKLNSNKSTSSAFNVKKQSQSRNQALKIINSKSENNINTNNPFKPLKHSNSLHQSPTTPKIIHNATIQSNNASKNGISDLSPILPVSKSFSIDMDLDSDDDNSISKLFDNIEYSSSNFENSKQFFKGDDIKQKTSLLNSDARSHYNLNKLKENDRLRLISNGDEDVVEEEQEDVEMFELSSNALSSILLSNRFINNSVNPFLQTDHHREEEYFDNTLNHTRVHSTRNPESPRNLVANNDSNLVLAVSPLLIFENNNNNAKDQMNSNNNENNEDQLGNVDPISSLSDRRKSSRSNVKPNYSDKFHAIKSLLEEFSSEEHFMNEDDDDALINVEEFDDQEVGNSLSVEDKLKSLFDGEDEEADYVGKASDGRRLNVNFHEIPTVLFEELDEELSFNELDDFYQHWSSA